MRSALTPQSEVINSMIYWRHGMMRGLLAGFREGLNQARRDRVGTERVAAPPDAGQSAGAQLPSWASKGLGKPSRPSDQATKSWQSL